MTTQTQTLTDFLLARITEDEEQAPAEHYAPFEREWEWCPAALSEPFGDHAPGPCACNFPKARRRVLAECEAKRRIVEAYLTSTGVAPIPDKPGLTRYWEGCEDAYADALNLLAQPYADHPDFREEWRP